MRTGGVGDLDCVSCVSDGLCVCSFVSVVVCVSPSKICVYTGGFATANGRGVMAAQDGAPRGVRVAGQAPRGCPRWAGRRARSISPGRKSELWWARAGRRDDRTTSDAVGACEMVEGAESSADGVLEAAMLQAMHEADAAAAASLRPTVEEERERMEELREHVVAHGGNPKAGNEHGYVGCMRRNFERFLEKHGAAYGYDAEEGPTLQLARQFMDYCFSGAARWQTYSAVGRRGFYDGYFEVHLPYTLAQKVFPAMALPGWGGLEASARRAKAEPFKAALKEHWEALRTSRAIGLTVRVCTVH